MRVKQKRIVLGMFLVLVCTLTIGMSAFAADVTMKNKKWISGQGCSYVDTNQDGVLEMRSNGTAYYKIKVEKQGYIKVEVKEIPAPGAAEYWEDEYQGDNGTKVRLLTAGKKEIDKQEGSYSDNKNWAFTAAVKKGTYYLAVDSENAYQIRYSFTAVGKLSKAGTKASKAPALPAGKTVKNLIFPKKEQYYKVTLSQKKKITLSFASKIQGNFLSGLTVRVFQKKGSKLVCVDETGKLREGTIYYWDVSGKDKITLNLPAGTYYVDVMAFNTSGYYTMKWR